MLPKLWRPVEFQGQLLYWRKGASKRPMTCGGLVIQESSCQALQPLNWNLQLSPDLHAEVDWLGSFFFFSHTVPGILQKQTKTISYVSHM